VTLGLQVLGLLLAALLLSATVWGKVTRAGAATGLVAASLTAALLFSSSIGEVLAGFDQRREETARIPPFEAATRGGANLGVDAPFVEWVRERVRPGETFYLLPDGLKLDEATYQWTTWRLTPNVAATRVEDADVLIFFEAPGSLRYPAGEFGLPLRFAPDRALARRSRAG
jgi:hypothetical protein